jgi:hypothetical protein
MRNLRAPAGGCVDPVDFVAGVTYTFENPMRWGQKMGGSRVTQKVFVERKADQVKTDGVRPRPGAVVNTFWT